FATSSAAWLAVSLARAPNSVATRSRIELSAMLLSRRVPRSSCQANKAASSTMASNTTTKAALAYFNLRVTALTRDSAAGLAAEVIPFYVDDIGNRKRPRDINRHLPLPLLVGLHRM